MALIATSVHRLRSARWSWLGFRSHRGKQPVGGRSHAGDDDRAQSPALLAGLALLASSLVGCNWPERTRYVHPVFDAYDVTPGIVYRQTTRWNGEPIQLKLDVYQPRGDTKAERPVMMWMFGGGWRFGDRNQLATRAQDSARRKAVGVTIDYRIRGDQDPFDLLAAEIDAYDDTIAAIQWLRTTRPPTGSTPTPSCPRASPPAPSTPCTCGAPARGGRPTRRRPAPSPPRG